MEFTVSTLLSRPARGVTLNQVYFAFCWIAFLTIGQFSGQGGNIEHALAAGKIAGLARRLARHRRHLAHLDEVIHPGVQGERREAQKQAIQRAFAAMGQEARKAWASGQSYILLGYLLLLLEAYGLGSVPMLGFDPERVRAILGLPSHAAIPALVALGYPAEEGYPSHRLPLERVVLWR
mgnify:CR=1 FL=1